MTYPVTGADEKDTPHSSGVGPIQAGLIIYGTVSARSFSWN
jgi:hypothetical protein